jgi:hypothetical protein
MGERDYERATLLLWHALDGMLWRFNSYCMRQVHGGYSG